MKNIKISLAAGLLLATSAAFGGIIGSPHDLSSTGGFSGAATSNDNGEICVYCHTPHAGNASFSSGGNAPLWNKAPLSPGAGDDASFNMYAITIAGTAQATTVANPSLACLSCHDGVSSIDSLVNSPGSGSGTTPTARTISGLTVVGNTNADIGDMSGVGLAKTHPISIPYGGLANGTNSAAAGSPASLRPTTAVLAAVDVSGSAWVGGTTISDLLRAGNIECGSCHDPHNGYGSGSADIYNTGNTDRNVEVNFLRHTNNGSKLCIGCHDK